MTVALLFSSHLLLFQAAACFSFSWFGTAKSGNFRGSFASRRHLTATSEPFGAAVVRSDVTLLDQRFVRRGPPSEFADVWDALKNNIHAAGNNSIELTASEALKKLQEPLKRFIANETAFDVSLFEALQDCLRPSMLPLLSPDGKEKNDPNFFLLDVGNTDEYAVGFVRQKRVVVSLVTPAVEDGSRGGRTTYGIMSPQSVPDHAVCLFKKLDDGKWAVLDFFAVVDLKMSDTSCEAFPVQSDVVFGVALLRNHSALGQVMLHNMDCVLHHHARRGVRGVQLPLAILAGKKVGDNSISDAAMKQQKSNLRWVSGTIDIPLACGDSFSFAVQDFGRFCVEGAEEELSIRQAVALYLETLLFGLRTALVVQANLVNNRVPWSAVPASGQGLVIGDAMLNLPLCASPIADANVVWTESAFEHWKVSQGELFKGRLVVGDILRQSTSDYIHFTDDNEEGKETDVVIKVSSLAVHNLLVTPTNSYTALTRAKSDERVAKVMGTVLLAVVRKQVGLVTVMNDLTKQGYEILKPGASCDSLGVLWGGFQELVETWLVPLAEIGIVHTDMRPGYDVTANILVKLEGSKDAVKAATMKLIDFESLVTYNEWKAPTDDGRYIANSPDWDAMTFLWWQCIGVAYSWKEALSGNSLRYNAGMGRLTIFLTFSGGPDWLAKFRASAQQKIISQDDLKSTLDALAQEFL